MNQYITIILIVIAGLVLFFLILTQYDKRKFKQLKGGYNEEKDESKKSDGNAPGRQAGTGNPETEVSLERIRSRIFDKQPSEIQSVDVPGDIETESRDEPVDRPSKRRRLTRIE